VSGEDPELLGANQAFYDAFESRDLDRMGSVWDDGATSLCVHPGWPVIHGWEAIRESWERIFRGTTRIQFIVTEARASRWDGVGTVTCVENIVQSADQEMPSAFSSVQAINVFRRVDGAWRMVIHHASPLPPR